jgi:hypothetical protein
VRRLRRTVVSVAQTAESCVRSNATLGSPPELYRPVFPCLIQGGCGRRGSNGRIQGADVSDGRQQRRAVVLVS